ncbi:hypothetical protein ACWCSD_42335 [Nonomuraea sp. NPDC001684]
MTDIVTPRRVAAWNERTSYPTPVIDRYDWLRCAAPCNNDPHGSGFEYLPNEPGLASLPAGTDLDALYVCLDCRTVITIDVPAWDPARQAAEERNALGQALLNRDHK